MLKSKDLLMSMLAMDSYNRGYDEGLSGLVGAGSMIGAAKMSTTPLKSEQMAAGFYAAAYSTPYGNVISYRGTDKYLGDESIGGDIWNGWRLGAGFDLQAAE